MGPALSVLLLCVKVFCCRIADVSLGTLRTIQVVKGRRLYAAGLGFMESGLWFLVVREAITSDMGGLPITLAYAAGFSTGTLLGCVLADKIIETKICFQVVTSKRDDDLIAAIRDAGYAVSVVEVLGSKFGEQKYMLFIEIESTKQKEVRNLIRTMDEKAFIMVQESKSVYNGYFGK
ncbi:MAG TPA: DUF5698 domain-containing protein [Oscillospiraceae bacterium]|nr:DUF5698 domain-containing protein [Oscillospiraceae bacterium]